MVWSLFLSGAFAVSGYPFDLQRQRGSEPCYERTQIQWQQSGPPGHGGLVVCITSSTAAWTSPPDILERASAFPLSLPRLNFSSKSNGARSATHLCSGHCSQLGVVQVSQRVVVREDCELGAQEVVFELLGHRPLQSQKFKFPTGVVLNVLLRWLQSSAGICNHS